MSGVRRTPGENIFLRRVVCFLFRRLTERDFFIDNLLVRIRFIIEMIWWTGLAPWEFEFAFSGSLTSTLQGPAGSDYCRWKTNENTRKLWESSTERFDPNFQIPTFNCKNKTSEPYPHFFQWILRFLCFWCIQHVKLCQVAQHFW